MKKARELPVVNEAPEPGSVGRRQVLQGLLAGVSAAIPGATRAHPMSPAPASAAAVQAATAKAQAADWKPEFLDPHQLATLQALCERIVPGSLAARSDRFVDSLLAVDTRENQRRFLSALGAMDADASRRFGKPFKMLSEAQQVEVLGASAHDKPGREDWVWTPGTIMRQPEPTPPKTTPRDHFDLLKKSIATAYYSSEAGVKELGSTGQQFFATFPDCAHEGGHGDQSG
jgi:gluconate 2-dehydrogenase subunit 3-like protein